MSAMESYWNESLACHVKDDEAVWSMFKKGDKEAFAILYQRHFIMLFQYGTKLADDSDLVKDCVHDVFLDLWKKKENLADPNSVKAYLLSSVQHKLIRQLSRARSRENEIMKIESPVVVECREDQMIEDQIQLEQNHIVSKALRVLTKRQHEAVYLKFYCNLSYKEVAATMSISVDSIYNLISKAIDDLQLELNKVPVPKL
jgi:RNA polymerase sigma factor (sigma-70 family)